MAYRIASKKEQARLRRPIGDYLPSYYETLKPEEQRDVLKAVLLRLEEDLMVETDKWRRKELGITKFELQKAMTAIRPKRKAPGVEFFFVQVCKEQMTLAHYNSVMGAAAKLLRESQGKKE